MLPPLNETNIRALRARWVVTGQMRLTSAAHFGGDQAGPADAMVQRVPLTDVPLLPGTSLAGALRGHLGDVLGGYISPEAENVARLFGSIGDDGEPGRQSALIVFDSDGTVPPNLGFEIRDGVALDPATGIAAAHAKYEIEVLPAGTSFPLRVDLLITEADDERQLLQLLDTALRGLVDGGIALGAKRTRGLGSVCVENLRARRFDLATRAGWMAWAASDWKTPLASESEAWPPTQIVTSSVSTDLRDCFIAGATLRIHGALLVAGPPVEADAPDAAHVASGGASVLPGTSLAGVLRSRALKIASVVREAKGDSAQWIDDLFGRRGQTGLKASRIRTSERHITGGSRERTTRIQLDRFTQAVVHGAMLEEEPLIGGTLEVTLEVRKPLDGEAGLVLLLLKDLVTGDLPLGGTGAIGRGVVSGEAWFRLSDATTIALPPALGDAQAADELIAKFWNAASRSAEATP